MCVCVCVCGNIKVSGMAALREWNQGGCRGGLVWSTLPGSPFFGLRGHFGEMLTRGMGINLFSSLGDRFYMSVGKSFFVGGGLGIECIYLSGN